MPLRIERLSMEPGTRIRLSGQLRCEQQLLRTEIERDGKQVTLDPDELNLVDIHAVRFLNACEAQNVKIVNCTPFIREWMFQERGSKCNPERT
jgi:hypothetical protein